MSTPPNPFKPSQFGHLPQHWYAHVMHSLEVIGYHHPEPLIREQAHEMYKKMAHNFHLNIETKQQQWARLTEDRIAKGEVVS